MHGNFHSIELLRLPNFEDFHVFLFFHGCGPNLIYYFSVNNIGARKLYQCFFMFIMYGGRLMNHLSS